MRGSWVLVAVVALVAGREARAEGLRAPQNVNAEPGNRQSAELATRSALAQMNGNAAGAVLLANQGIRADSDDPWPYYNKGMALSALGQVNAAVAALSEAERRFSAADLWGRSVAIYGRAHALSQVGRCAEAREAFGQYASLVESHDAASAEMARRYAARCQAAAPAPAASAAAPAAPTPPAPAPQSKPPAPPTVPTFPATPLPTAP
jgi:tetratricopeptide (TPR) repeat protein